MTVFKSNVGRQHFSLEAVKIFRMIKAVIYDLDDLMVNSYPLHVKASNHVFRKYGVDSSKLPRSIRSGFIGMRVSDILKYLVDYFKLDVNLENLREKRSAIFLDLVNKNLKAMPGLLQSLKLFKKNKFKIALASSGTKKYINVVLGKFKIADYFDVIVSGDDVKRGKPDPEIFSAAVNKLGLKPDETLVLEDATNGIEAAKAAGCKCIAVINKMTPPQNYSKADLVINSLKEIDLALIREL